MRSGGRVAPVSTGFQDHLAHQGNLAERGFQGPMVLLAPQENLAEWGPQGMTVWTVKKDPRGRLDPQAIMECQGRTDQTVWFPALLDWMALRVQRAPPDPLVLTESLEPQVEKVPQAF